MPSFSSGMFVTFKLSLMPEFIGGLKEIFYAASSFWDSFRFKELSSHNKVLLLK
jgi:hypothetical protein